MMIILTLLKQMYLILYEDRTGVCALPRYYDYHWSIDINNALTAFYESHPYETICASMFDDIIRSLTIDQAVALHNAICPRFYITKIIKSDRTMYAETEEK